jgi:hypothetical protein
MLKYKYRQTEAINNHQVAASVLFPLASICKWNQYILLTTRQLAKLAYETASWLAIYTHLILVCGMWKYQGGPYKLPFNHGNKSNNGIHKTLLIAVKFSF